MVSRAWGNADSSSAISLALLRKVEVHCRCGGVLRSPVHRFGHVPVRSDLECFFVELPRELVPQVCYHSIDLGAPDRIVVDPPLAVDQLPRFFVELFATFDVELPIPHQGLVQCQHQPAPIQRPAHCRKARCGDFLEDRHHQSETLALPAFPLREVESVPEVAAHHLVEALFLLAHEHRFGVHPTPGEQRLAVHSACVRLGPANDHGVEAVPVLHHVFGAVEQRRVQQLDEHPELKVVPLVGSRGEQDEVARVVLERLGELVVLGLVQLPAGAEGRQVVRLVDDGQIPPGCFKQSPDSRTPLQGVDARDQAIMLGERVCLSVGDVPFRPEHLEFEVEDFVQLLMPVVDESCGNHHQRALQLSSACQFAQNERGLDGLPEAYLVGDEEPSRRCRRNAVGQHDLVRQQVDRR